MTTSDSQTSATSDVLVLLAHPDLAHSRTNQAMRRAALNLEPTAVVRDLYSLYPDYLIDVATEQSLLAQARLVVWQHPIHWYHMPPLMKLWLDEVLTFGWAYGPGGTALQGKDLWLAISTGGSESSYHPEGHNRYAFDAYLTPYRQTTALCGMRFLDPMVLHGAHGASDAAIQTHAMAYAERLRTYPHWPELKNSAECSACTTLTRGERPGPAPEAA